MELSESKLTHNGGTHIFEKPKPKDNLVRFLSYFINLNNQLKRKPYPMPNINGILLKVESFIYATSPDLNVLFYHIQLTEYASKFCTIIILWGKYCYNNLQMVYSNSPDIF